MKRNLFIALAITLAILALPSCRQAETPAPSGGTTDTLIAGSQEADGAVTAGMADGSDLVDAKDSTLHYVASGPGHFEVKSAPAWTNITTSTASLTAAGADKILKLDLGLVGVKKQYEVTYAFDTSPNLKASTWTTKLFVPAVYATPGLTTYPTIALYVKAGANWTGIKVAEFNTLNLGSGWKTIAINFATSKLTVDGVDKTAATEFAASFADVAASFGDCPGITLSFYGDGLDAGLVGPFYLDYLNVTGISLAQAVAPTLSTAANAVTMTTSTTDAEIYFTIDNSAPSKTGLTSTKYTAPVAITANTTFKAIAVKTGMADSNVTTFDAVFGAAPDSSVLGSFESDVTGWAGNATYFKASTAYAQNTAPAFVKKGSGSLKVDVTYNTTGGWDDVGKALAEVTWNAAGGKDLQNKAISAWIYVPAEMAGFKANLVAKDASWGQLTVDNWVTLTAGWNELTLAATSTAAAGWATTYALDIVVAAGAASTFSGSFYIDAVDATTAVAADASVLGSFESDVTGWAGNATYFKASTAYAQNTAAAFVKKGTGSLKVDVTYNTTGGWDDVGKALAEVTWNAAGGKDLQNKAISAWIYVPAEMAGFKANLVAKDSSWGQLTVDNWVTLTAGWNELTLAATSTAAAGWATTYALDIVVAAGAASTFSGSFYVDAVDAQ